MAGLDRESVCLLDCLCYLWNSIRYWWIITMLMDMAINILIRQILQIHSLKKYSKYIISKYKSETGEKFCSGRDSVLSFCWKQYDSHMCMTEGAFYGSTKNYIIIDLELPWATHSWFQPRVNLDMLVTPVLQVMLVQSCPSAWNVQ